MAITDLAENAVRNVLRLFEDAGKEVETHSSLEPHVHDAVEAIHRAADSLDRQVEVLDGVAAALPALTAVLAKLSEDLAEALTLLHPVEGAEREVSGLAHLFHRHHEEPGES